MKPFYYLLSFIFTASVWAQGGPIKHPRVVEVEDLLRDEVSRYFTRRFPSSPFYIRVEINPLRRDMVAGQKMESLPYFDYESEESVDEWDDLNTPLSFLRRRVTKVSIQLDVTDDFDDARLAEIKEEIMAYLKLLPFRDDVKVNRKIKVEKPLLPIEYYWFFSGGIVCLILLGFIVRNGLKKNSLASSPSAPAALPITSSLSTGGGFGRENSRNSHGGSPSITTMHDPLKTVDIVHLKIEQIEKTGTFPTLKDLISLQELGEKNPSRLGALVYEIPSTWQRKIFPLGHGQSWLEAFSRPGPVDHECLVLLDTISKERNFSASNRETEDLLIQLWRMKDKASSLLKKIPQEHAFVLLGLMPKSFSLNIAKKTFPGAWGRLLENTPCEFTYQAGLDE